ncbi:polysaccharide biosynthesis C-terminal domain-containing protein [Weissella cibaria]|uniref:polysaccharide biosynthesis C-terminal domain-containing protein n=1 Tax=Weissella cibaria TaxID=137591 RepID=UPI001898E49B
MALRIIAWAIIFSIFSWILSDCVLIPSKREKLLLRTTLITACFNVALNFVLIPIMSYDGTSLTTVLSEFLSMSLNLYWSFDIVKDIMVVKDNQKAMFTSVTGCLFIVIYCSLVQYCVSSMWINIIVLVVGSVLGYFGILFLLKNPVVTSYVTDFMKRRNH